MKKLHLQDSNSFQKHSFIREDNQLLPFSENIRNRCKHVVSKEDELCGGKSLGSYSNGYLYYGVQRLNNLFVFREYAPNAKSIYLIGDFNNWEEKSEFKFLYLDNGIWELKLCNDLVNEGDEYLLMIYWEGGKGRRIPAYARRVVQNKETTLFNASLYVPKEYKWEYSRVKIETPLIYELHIGMSGEGEGITTFNEFRENVLPYIADCNYNVIQLMGIQEHPYYGSYGYHVANFYAVSSRFGTPDDLKKLIDQAHGLGIAVVIDLIHSHSIRNENEGIGNYDGDPELFFHSGDRRIHKAWDSLCFNYSKNCVLHFLLSNCKYWLDEYNIDGFRFDGVTSMIYKDHGLGKDFLSYHMYYDGNQDEDALVYLALANKLIHEVYPDAISIAEEMSGMPGICSEVEDGGYGFDYRLAMGIPDYWIKIIKECKDEDWNPGDIFFQLTNNRNEEKPISYCESHDQALVGDKTIIFRLLGKDMYDKMSKFTVSLNVDRGMALHKIIRLMTFGTSGGGYLNFMGNEFGHPEWIDFPREGNNWSFRYARRQWSLLKDKTLKYHFLADFDVKMLELEMNYSFINSTRPVKVFEMSEAQLLAFSRGDLLFVINLNPVGSFKDLSIKVVPGKYKIVLNTDSTMFGGHGRVDDSMLYYSSGADLKIYLPARTGIVFKRLKSRTVY